MEEFRIGTETDDDWMIFRVEGDVDVYTSPRLSASLAEAMDKPGIKEVRLDLSRVNFMDSTGLSVIVGGHKRATTNNIRFRLFQPRPQIRRILQVTDLVNLLSIEDEPSEGANAYR